MRKRIALLGSTGSVGNSTLQVVRHLPEDLEIAVLAAKSNIDSLEKQAREFSPRMIAVYDPVQALVLQKRLPHIPVLAGVEGLKAAASFEGADFVMLAMSGSAGLIPAIAAIEAGKQIGLANKEILVCAGEWISKLAQKHKVTLFPVDSEHSALFQCLKGENGKTVRRLILTASGGPFLNRSAEELQLAAMEEALTHPHWKIGAGGMVNSSTLINKGFEMIEARWLFDIPPEKIDVVIHPQSRIQSCVEFVDSSVMALISEPNMAVPIQYALTYPNRRQGILPAYDFFKYGTWTFHPPDKEKFLCLKLAADALRSGKSYPCFLNGANEVLVERFLRKEISWSSIGTKLEKLISSHQPENLLTLEAILTIDQCAREKASSA